MNAERTTTFTQITNAIAEGRKLNHERKLQLEALARSQAKAVLESLPQKVKDAVASAACLPTECLVMWVPPGELNRTGDGPESAGRIVYRELQESGFCPRWVKNIGPETLDPTCQNFLGIFISVG